MSTTTTSTRPAASDSIGLFSGTPAKIMGVIAIVVIVLVLAYQSPTQYKDTRPRLILEVAAAVGVLFLLYNFLRSRVDNQIDWTRRVSELTEEQYSALADRIRQITPLAPNFSASAYPTDTELRRACSRAEREITDTKSRADQPPPSPAMQECKSLMASQTLSVALIRKIEDFVDSRDLDHIRTQAIFGQRANRKSAADYLTQDVEWLTTFLQWVNDPQLQKDWHEGLSVRVGQRTRQFMSMLIGTIDSYTPKTAMDFHQAAVALAKSLVYVRFWHNFTTTE